MSYKYVIDAYAWIEYFRASDEGEKAKSYIEEENSATPTIVVAEVSRKLITEVSRGRETQDGKEKKLEFIRASTQIIQLDFDTAKLAGQTDTERKRLAKNWGMADSIILAAARSAGAKVVTGDYHFKDLKGEVIMIK